LVLKDAVEFDTVNEDGSRARPETILVITDGMPDSQEEVERVIIEATKDKMSRQEDLSITIVQIGDDPDATAWLKELDNGLVEKGARFDIVDVISHEQMKAMDFVTIIKRSVQGGVAPCL
jgi:hypothetical protein